MEFHDWFAREEDCRAYLVRTRWPEGIQCPRCEARDPWRMKEPFYRCSGCGHDFTVTAGTLFADTHKPLRVWFEAIWHMTNQKNGVSALGLQRALGLGSYRTAWNWLHKLRRAMVRPGRDRLVGVVEVDEAFIGGAEPGKRGRGAAGKSLILVCAQVDGRKIGRIRLARIADASRKSLGEAVQQMVESGAEVQTDGWRGYRGLEIAGYRHRIVRESATRTICCPASIRWSPFSSAGCSAPTRERAGQIIWITISTSSPFASTAAHPDPAGCCFTD
jgi:transposase-like protein